MTNPWDNWREYLTERGIRLYRVAPASAADVPAAPPDADSAEDMPQPERSAPPTDRPSVLPDDAETSEPAPAAAAAPTPQEPETLEAIRADLGDCQRCKLASTRTNIVFGEGNPQARLMFVGEGPGADEDRTGRPFVGKAGQLLDKMINAMGLQREDVYIANIIKCRPPGNRDPEPDEIAACLPFLERQIRAIGPDVIVTLGKPAARALLGLDGPISRYRGVWQDYEGIAVMPTWHPAYLLRNPAAKRDAWNDLQAVMQRLGLPRAEG